MGFWYPQEGIQPGERNRICTKNFISFLLTSSARLSEYTINESTAEQQVDKNLRTLADVHTLVRGTLPSPLAGILSLTFIKSSRHHSFIWHQYRHWRLKGNLFLFILQEIIKIIGLSQREDTLGIIFVFEIQKPPATDMHLGAGSTFSFSELHFCCIMISRSMDSTFVSGGGCHFSMWASSLPVGVMKDRLYFANLMAPLP